MTKKPIGKPTATGTKSKGGRPLRFPHAGNGQAGQAVPLSVTPSPGTEQAAGHLTLVSPATPRRTKVRTAKSVITGLTVKQEAFCHGIIEGKSLSDAYRAAYVTENMAPATIHTQACVMFNDPVIANRIRMIMDEMAEKRRMLASSDIELALATLRELSVAADTDASRIRAAEILAKAAGAFTETVEIKDTTDRSEMELEEAIRQRLGRVGLAG